MSDRVGKVTCASMLWYPMSGGRVNRHEKERRQRDFLHSRLSKAASPHVIVTRAELTPGFPSSIYASDPSNVAQSWLLPLSGDGNGKPIVDLKQAVYVGEDLTTGRNVFVTTPENVDPAALTSGKFLNTRVLCAELDEQALALMGLAVSMLSWVRAERFCSRCGSTLVVRDLGMFQKCSSCKALHFPRINPAMIVCVLDGRGNVLLSQRKRKSFKSGSKIMRTVLSGFVSHGESQEDTVVREVEEESGAVVSYVRYAGSQPWPYPYQLMSGYYALAEHSKELTLEAEELVNVAWVPKEEVRKALQGEHPEFFVPPKFSAAGVLLSAWVEGRVNDRGEDTSAASKL